MAEPVFPLGYRADDDPFATAKDTALPPPPMDSPRRGRYYLPWKDGSKKPYGFMRVSNLVSAFSDQFALRQWEQVEILKGMIENPALIDRVLASGLTAMDKASAREWVSDFVELAKEASGGNAGAAFGVQRHEAVEAYHAGLPQSRADAGTRQHLALYEMALQRNGLRALSGMQERRILVEELEVVGTLDNVMEDLRDSCLRIVDLKTQRKFWSWLEVEAQFASYAHGDAMWDRERECWVDMPPGIDQEIGYIAWMPRETEDGEPRVDILDVDLVSGWKTAKLAFEVVQRRSAAKSAKGRSGRHRVAPVADETEKMVARFAAAETSLEARALVAECKAANVWNAVTAEAAAKAKDRILFPA